MYFCFLHSPISANLHHGCRNVYKASDFYMQGNLNTSEKEIFQDIFKNSVGRSLIELYALLSSTFCFPVPSKTNNWSSYFITTLYSWHIYTERNKFPFFNCTK